MICSLDCGRNEAIIFLRAFLKCPFHSKRISTFDDQIKVFCLKSFSAAVLNLFNHDCISFSNSSSLIVSAFLESSIRFSNLSIKRSFSISSSMDNSLGKLFKCFNNFSFVIIGKYFSSIYNFFQYSNQLLNSAYLQCFQNSSCKVSKNLVGLPIKFTKFQKKSTLCETSSSEL